VVEIKKEWCKACGVCIYFCSQKVLVMKDFKAFAQNPEKCTDCQLCELRCPDFAITCGAPQKKSD
jgi:2-oxoglutarate ferredoxin oxidoreductase subunit delta